jgi:hypothetical protein
VIGSDHKFPAADGCFDERRPSLEASQTKQAKERRWRVDPSCDRDGEEIVLQ